MNPPPDFGRIVLAQALGRGPTELASATCVTEPVYALVVAVYAAQPW